MDRKLFKVPFRENHAPNWLCPRCDVGLLRMEPETFFRVESEDSKRMKEHDAWDPEWIRYRFSSMLACTNDQCGDHVALVGTGDVSIDVIFQGDGEPEQEWADFFTPKFFEPPLKLISIPEDCPEAVRAPLTESFRLVFSSPAAASNSTRIALEALLTELRVPRFSQTSGKKRGLLSLHARIGLLPKKFEELKEMFFAVKWLGNAGSHSGRELSLDDAFDAYELVAHILDSVYSDRSKKLASLAKKVNKKKGPSTRKR
jgi:hypothetical protein